MRILASCQILEDIATYNNVHVMFNSFSATYSRMNEYAEGCDNYWEHVNDTTGASDTRL